MVYIFTSFPLNAIITSTLPNILLGKCSNHPAWLHTQVEESGSPGSHPTQLGANLSCKHMIQLVSLPTLLMIVFLAK